MAQKGQQKCMQQSVQQFGVIPNFCLSFVRVTIEL
jgi:hypothetical protein